MGHFCKDCEHFCYELSNEEDDWGCETGECVERNIEDLHENTISCYLFKERIEDYRCTK